MMESLYLKFQGNVSISSRQIINNSNSDGGDHALAVTVVLVVPVMSISIHTKVDLIRVEIDLINTFSDIPRNASQENLARVDWVLVNLRGQLSTPGTVRLANG